MHCTFCGIRQMSLYEYFPFFSFFLLVRTSASIFCFPINYSSIHMFIFSLVCASIYNCMFVLQSIPNYQVNYQHRDIILPSPSTLPTHVSVVGILVLESASSGAHLVDDSFPEVLYSIRKLSSRSS